MSRLFSRWPIILRREGGFAIWLFMLQSVFFFDLQVVLELDVIPSIGIQIFQTVPVHGIG